MAVRIKPRLTVIAHSEVLSGCAYSPDGSHIVTSSWDEEARVWNTETGELMQVLSAHCDPLYDCAWSADGALIATAGDEPALALFDAASGDCLAELWPESTIMFSCAFSPDTSSLYAVDHNDQLWVFDPNDRKDPGRKVGSGYSGWFPNLEVSHDGSLLAVGNEEGGLRFLNVVSGEIIGDFNELLGDAWRCAFFPGDDRLLLGTKMGEMAILQVDSLKLLKRWNDGNGAITACAVSPDGGFLAYAQGGIESSPDGETVEHKVVLTLRDGSAAEPLAHHTFPSAIKCMSFDPSGMALALGDSVGVLRLMDIEGLGV